MISFQDLRNADVELRQLTGFITTVSVCPAGSVTLTLLKVVVSFFQTL